VATNRIKLFSDSVKIGQLVHQSKIEIYGIKENSQTCIVPCERKPGRTMPAQICNSITNKKQHSFNKRIPFKQDT